MATSSRNIRNKVAIIAACSAGLAALTEVVFKNIPSPPSSTIIQKPGNGDAINAGRDVILNNKTSDDNPAIRDERYKALKRAVKAACQNFHKGVLRFSGQEGDSCRDNIYCVPEFPFNLLDTIEKEQNLFVEKEGEGFFSVMQNFSLMKQGYDSIQRTKLDTYAANRFD